MNTAEKLELSKHGSAIERSFVLVSDSLAFYHYFLTPEWEEVYRPDYYQGVWINKRILQICSYTEGDVVTTFCKDEEAFDDEVSDYWSWYEANA